MNNTEQVSSAGHQMSAAGEKEPQLNMFEQVFSFSHQMSLAGVRWAGMGLVERVCGPVQGTPTFPLPPPFLKRMTD